MKKTLLCAAAAIVTMVPAAFAQDTGWYGRADLGYTFDSTTDLDGTRRNLVGALDGQGEGSGEIFYGFGLGYGLANNFRFEGEIAQRQTDFAASGLRTLGNVASLGLPAGNAQATVLAPSGSARILSGMLNGYYDFNRGGAAQPYVGLGFGVGRMSAHAQTVVRRLGAQPLNGFSDSDLTYAGQALAGVAFQVAPRLKVDVGYRYFVMPDLEFQGRDQDYEGAHQDHTVTAGLRWQFAAPPPAVITPPPPPPVVTPPPPPPVITPPPPPPPVERVTPPIVAPVCANQNFVVYFDWDRSNLTAEAESVIAGAVNSAMRCQPTSVSIEGHADRSGSARYNVGLSQRRAAAVKAALEARGIAASIISTTAAGESRPAVQTPDGVREPLNRRSEVVIVVR